MRAMIMAFAAVIVLSVGAGWALNSFYPSPGSWSGSGPGIRAE